MDQESFEQPILAVLSEVPEEHRMTILAMVQDSVKEQIRNKTKKRNRYAVRAPSGSPKAHSCY